MALLVGLNLAMYHVISQKSFFGGVEGVADLMFILNEDTHPAILAIGLSHKACNLLVSMKSSISQLRV